MGQRAGVETGLKKKESKGYFYVVEMVLIIDSSISGEEEKQRATVS